MRPASHDREHAALAWKEYKNFENLFHFVYSVSADDHGNYNFLTSDVGHFLLAYSRVFFLPYDKVLHLAATHLHHKVLFIHGSLCFGIVINTDPFIWAFLPLDATTPRTMN